MEGLLLGIKGGGKQERAAEEQQQKRAQNGANASNVPPRAATSKHKKPAKATAGRNNTNKRRALGLGKVGRHNVLAAVLEPQLGVPSALLSVGRAGGWSSWWVV